MAGMLVDAAILGQLYESGEGVPKDYGLARKFYQKSCDGGMTPDCEKLRSHP